jgi:small conductance mechanosensitive channel
MVFASLYDKLTDSRFDANLVAFYGAMVLVVLVSLVLRRLLHRQPGKPGWSGLQWLNSVNHEAIFQIRKMILWGTSGTVALLSLGGLGYHLAGRDVRVDLGTWWNKYTAEELLHVGLNLMVCVVLYVVARVAVMLIRRFMPVLQHRLAAMLGTANHEEVLKRWFLLMEGFSIAAVRLWAVWMAACVMGLEHIADLTIGFLVRIGTILVLARLVTLGCRVVTRLISGLGNHHLASGPLARYWERIDALLPFGERCIAWGVYLLAGSWCMRVLIHAVFGPLHTLADNPSEIAQVLAEMVPVIRAVPKFVHCMIVFFATRVGIEILQVVLNEAFGLYREDGNVDAKGRTLVPLLHSLCQYVLYIGAGVMMLDHLGVNVLPILTGIGVLGLAVGLGAQSLVNDVVSGFFILFESQYLVGDYVQIGDACGTVEAVGIRSTHIRDAQGKLYIIPNGQIKGIVSFSKGYVNAVVDVKVPAGEDLERVFRSMSDAGKRLRLANKEVLADTVIQGLVELGTSEMTVRAVTKVHPGRHVVMQNEYRRVLKQVFDEARQSAVRAAA